MSTAPPPAEPGRPPGEPPPDRGPADRGRPDTAAADRERADRGPRDRTADRELEELDPGLARERTSLAWTRTAIAFAALGGVVLKVNVITGLIILAIAPVVWQLGRVSRSGSPGTELPAVGVTRIRLITVSIVAVSLLSLLVAVLGRSAPGALR